MPGDVVDWGHFYFEAKSAHHLWLLLQYFLFLEFSARYFLINDAKFQGMYFLVFRCWEHSCDSNQMQVFYL